MEKNNLLIFSCLSDWLDCLRDIKNNQNNADYDLQSIRLALVKAIARFEQRAVQWIDSNEQLLHAKYAMTALSDEFVISSQAGQHSSWLSHPLQLQLFGNIHAGEHFFALLAELRLDAEKNAAILEIYLLCLELGYRGQYLFQDEFQLKKLKAELQQQLLSIYHKRDGAPALPAAEMSVVPVKPDFCPFSKKILAISLASLCILMLTLSGLSFFRARYSHNLLQDMSGSILKQYQRGLERTS